MSKGITTKDLAEATRKMSKDIGRQTDRYLISCFQTLLNRPTTYKGHGRPKKTDYGIFKNELGEISKQIYRWHQ